NQTHIFTLLDTSRLKAQVFVSEDLLPQLAVNDMATINLESAGKKNMAQDFNGRITRIPPGLDPQTRQAEIEIEINPVPAGAMPGQLCNVTLHGKKIKKLMMDFDALRYDNHGAFVYVVRDNRVQRTAVQTGIQQDNSIEILQGVNAGDMVITKGFTGLQDGKTVNMTEQAK
ncbi:MAG: rane fusion protein multidrug efflux system, partial [Pseudomonadota bacterium]|nr:rane fusion protein multidrug efflux system [Pseudomonadota bacterium]